MHVYLLVKLLHIAAVIAFLGNIATGLFWHAHAARSRDPKLLASILDGIIRSDRIFTVPGVIAIVATGLAAAILGNLPILRTGWIFWGIVLFSLSGLIFALRVAPLQRQLRALANTAVQSGTFDYAGYHTLAVRWELWGGVALLTPLAALVLMVLKPSL
ncbi:MAG TPA: DUF2269 family protein [Steroidobacteraceae bacterium]|jgi:uncharacterized membrane protein|nr:DUF2269 family protein [Steroidobacteraceae bacterium]